MAKDYCMRPPECLVDEWVGEADKVTGEDFAMEIAVRAAQWGADQELEECCKWLKGEDLGGFARQLLQSRRPATLKAQALANLDGLCAAFGLTKEADAIRKALETLPD